MIYKFLIQTENYIWRKSATDFNVPFYRLMPYSFTRIHNHLTFSLWMFITVKRKLTILNNEVSLVFPLEIKHKV